MFSSLARVAAVHRGGLELITEAGPRAGFVTGRLRHGAASADLPAVGDWVTCDPESADAAPWRSRPVTKPARGPVSVISSRPPRCIAATRAREEDNGGAP